MKNKINHNGFVSKPMPSAPEVEKAVLAATLQDFGYYQNDFLTLRHDHFYDEKCRIVFVAITAVLSDGGSVNMLTVADHLRISGKLDYIGGAPYVSSIVSSTYTVGSYDYLVKILEQERVKRRIYEAGQRAMTNSTSEMGVDDLVASSLNDMAEACSIEMKDDYVPLGEVGSSSLATIREIQLGKATPGVSSGFSSLDQIVGPFLAGDYIVIGARPSVGKSQLAFQIAANVAKGGVPVGLFSIEMSEDSVWRRFTTMETGISSLRMNTPGSLSADDLERLSAADATIRDIPIYLDCQSRTMSAITMMTKRMVKRNHVGIIIIDYLQLVHMKGNYPNRNEEVAEISRMLKSLAKEHSVPVIALSQLNRASTQTMYSAPKMSELRESGAIEQDADVILLLSRDENDPTHNDIRVSVAKNRNGSIGDFDLQIEADTRRFVDSCKDAKSEGGFKDF